MIDRATLKRLWPKANPDVADSIVNSSAALFAKHNLGTSLRVSHFMAQISHESNGGSISEENLNYTTASRIAAVWPKRFTTESAEPFVRSSRALANKVYNGRMGNRSGSDDGWNYRGRGLIQLTGRNSYRAIGKLCGIDLENNPNLAADPKHAFDIACAEFVYLGCLPFADADDVRGVTRHVNGGYNGLDDKINWLAKWKAALIAMPIPAPPITMPPAPKAEHWLVTIIKSIAAIFRR